MVYDDKEFIAKKLKTARKNLGLTQEQLAEKIGISTQQVSRIETGVYIPSLPVFLRSADVLNLTLNDFGIKNAENKNRKKDELLKLIHTFDDRVLECCYNTIKTMMINIELLKK